MDYTDTEDDDYTDTEHGYTDIQSTDYTDIQSTDYTDITLRAYRQTYRYTNMQYTDIQTYRHTHTHTINIIQITTRNTQTPIQYTHTIALYHPQLHFCAQQHQSTHGISPIARQNNKQQSHRNPTAIQSSHNQSSDRQLIVMTPSSSSSLPCPLTRRSHETQTLAHPGKHNTKPIHTDPYQSASNTAYTMRRCDAIRPRLGGLFSHSRVLCVLCALNNPSALVLYLDTLSTLVQ